MLLVTGVTSFIGRHIALTLRRRGYDIVGTYRTPGRRVDDLEALDVQLVQLDLADAEAVATLPESIDAILHVAGESASTNTDDLIRSNVLGTRNLIRFSNTSRTSKFIFASSMSIYGRPIDTTVTESTCVRSPDVYGASKFMAERLLAEIDCPCVAIRLPGVLGSGAHRAWIPVLAERIAKRLSVRIHNPLEPFNNAAHVADLSSFAATLLRSDWSGFHAFPVGAGGMISAETVVRILMREMGECVDVETTEATSRNFIISSEYANRTFGYEPMDIEPMIARFAAEIRSGSTGAGWPE